MRTSTFWQGFSVSLALTFIFLYSLIFNINNPPDLSHGDSFHVILTLKHYMDVVLQNRWVDILQMPIFYGFADSLLYSELFIFHAVVALPIYLFFKDSIITYNVLSVLTIIFSVFSMFLLAKYITGRFWPSVLASVIYVFNPFVIGHFPDNLHYFSLQWIPLIFLYFEKFLKEQTAKFGFLIFLFLTLQLLTTITFGALLSVILPIYGLIRIWQMEYISNLSKLSHLKKFLNLGIVCGLVLFSTTAFGINQVYNIYFQGKTFGRDLAETAVFSPWVYDLFLTSPNNLIYGWGRQWSKENLPVFFFDNPEYIERNLFFGLGVWVLLITSFFIVRKSQHRKIWLASLVVVGFAVALSFGPRIRFSEYFSLPGPYGFLHQFHPLLQNLRVASRFMVLAFLFLGLIGAITSLEILKKPRGNIIIIIFIIVIILEYSSTPWQFRPIPEDLRQFYSVLEKQKDVDVLLELPIGNLFSRIGLSRGQFVETSYMLYGATLHNKKLINGYSSYTPVQYPARVEYLSVNFPTTLKLKTLQKWGVGAIAMHKREFQFGDEYDSIKLKLESLGVEKLYETSTLVLFKLKK